MFSVGNKLIVEAYKKEGLKSTTSNGFSMVQQKVAVKGLRLLVDANLVLGNSVVHIPAGSVAFIKEELLHTQPWATKVLESEEIPEKFLVVDAIHVDFFHKAD